MRYCVVALMSLGLQLRLAEADEKRPQASPCVLLIREAAPPELQQKLKNTLERTARAYQQVGSRVLLRTSDDLERWVASNPELGNAMLQMQRLEFAKSLSADIVAGFSGDSGSNGVGPILVAWGY